MEGSKLIVLHSYIVVLVILFQSTFAVGNDVKIDFPYEEKRHLIAGQYAQPRFNRVPVSTDDDDNTPAEAAIQRSGLTMSFGAKDDDSLLEDTSLSFDLNSGHSNLSLNTLGVLARKFNMPHERLAFRANDPLVTGQGELHSGSMGWKDKSQSVTRQRDSEMKLDPGVQSGSKNYQITSVYDRSRAVDSQAPEQLLKQIDDSESLVPYDHLSAIRPNRGIILSEGHHSSKILDSLRSKSVQRNSQSEPKRSYLSAAARTFEEKRIHSLTENWRGSAEVDRSAYNSLILDPLIKRLLASHSTSPVLVRRNKRTPLSELLQKEIFTDTDSDIPDEMSDEPLSILEDEVLFSIPQLRSASDVIDTPAVPNTTTPSPLIVIPTAAPSKQTPVPTAVPTPQPWPITTPYPPTTTPYAVPTPLLNTTISSSAFASLGAMGGTGELSFDQLPTTIEVDTHSTQPVSCLDSHDTLIINPSVPCDVRIKRQAPLSTDQMIELLQYHGIAENSPFTATSRRKASATFRNLLPFGSPDKERAVHQRFTVYQLAMLLEKKYLEKQGAWPRDHRSTDQDSSQTSDTTNRKVSERKSRVSRRVNFDLFDDEFDVSRHLRETEEQYIPEEFLKRMEPARQLGHFTGMHKRSADVDTDIGYCQLLDEQNEAGYLNLCSACQKTTNLGEDTFPSYINEVVCNPSQTGGCIQLSGTVHGHCFQTSIHVQMLRRQSGTCMIISSQGNLIMTDAWELYSQEIRTGCQCMIDKRSPLIG